MAIWIALIVFSSPCSLAVFSARRRKHSRLAGLIGASISFRCLNHVRAVFARLSGRVKELKISASFSLSEAFALSGGRDGMPGAAAAIGGFMTGGGFSNAKFTERGDPAFFSCFDIISLPVGLGAR